MTRTLTLLTLLLAGGCDELGYPEDDFEGWDQGAGEPFDDLPHCNVDDLEPNDGDEGPGLALGVVTAERAAVVCGWLDGAGVDNDGAYLGDIDLGVFTLLSPSRVRVSVTWVGDAQIDLHFHDGEQWAIRDSDVDGSVSFSTQLQAGSHSVAVAASDGYATDYLLSVALD